MAAYSLPAHKEFRFLLPALQLLMPYCGLGAARLLGSVGTGAASAPRRRQAQPGANASSSSAQKAGGRLRRWAGAACLLLQLPVAAYFLLVHQG